MSRHKLVKALDLDEELNDFEGGVEFDLDEELGAEDREQLRSGTIKVRELLGEQVKVTDKEIEDSLWHYYYDVDKTVNYLLNFEEQKVDVQRKTSSSNKVEVDRKKHPGAGVRRRYQIYGTPASMLQGSYRCSGGFLVSDFFKDSPWLDVPRERRGEILIEPLYPRWGLLGGTSKQDAPPKSKLAALAAARKRKENQKIEDDRNAAASVTLLNKLGKSSQKVKPDKGLVASVSTSQSVMNEQTVTAPTKKYPKRSPEDIKPSPMEHAQDTSFITPSPSPSTASEEQREVVVAAAPSTFARSMFGLVAEAQGPLVQKLDNTAVRAFENLAEFDFAGPSPDDIVLKAQNSKGQTSKPIKHKQPPVNKDTSLDEVAQGVNDVALDHPVRGKNLDVLAEFKKSKPKNAANFVVIGHVDAGKSTLMGRLLYDLNVVDQRTLEKYRKEADRLGKSSFALAWVLDQGTEERERGVTIDIAMNAFETERTKFTILDAPGHSDFVPNMIAGASQADFAILVIDASTGNFEAGLRGQTKEHALLVRSMGVQRVVVAVNKLDIVQWSQDRFEEIVQQISAFLTSAGFLLKNLAFVPCAGLTGENVVRTNDNAKASWYTGPTFISLLESSEPVTRALEKPLRLTIDDIFRGGIQNPLCVSGRVDAGNVQVGDIIKVMPANQKATVKGIEVDSETADWAVAGQNVILHLTDIEGKYLKPGDVICPPSAPVECTTSFTLKILAFEHITPMHCEIHRGRLHAPGRVANLVAQLDKTSGAVVKGKKLRLIKPGTVARVAVDVDDPIPLEQGGRVIIRAGGETVGAGLVE